jgi:hypothetical protein
MNRRELIVGSATVLTGVASLAAATGGAERPRALGRNNKNTEGVAAPWYHRSNRWGHTNITPRDLLRYDIPWWREYWKRNALEGVILSAGGILAYYPSKYPLQRQPALLNGRDLYGELARAAHADGLSVLARMDSSAASEEFYRAHPDWFARQQSGEPYRNGDLYLTCISGPYFREYVPDVLKEIMHRSSPEGFVDNGWLAMGQQICYCDRCAKGFRERTGLQLPVSPNWENIDYRQWVQWNYERHTELFEVNNRVTKEAGGPSCLWVAMFPYSSYWNAFPIDVREIAKRSEFIVVDRQTRAEGLGFQENGDVGKQLHQIAGWSTGIVEDITASEVIDPPLEYEWAGLILPPESPDADANMTRIFPTLGADFQLAAKPEPEVRLWMLEAVAGGMGPSAFMAGAFHEDKRFFRSSELSMQWHKRYEEYLTNRQPIAQVGLVWSQRNAAYFGRAHCAELVGAPYQGFVQSLVRARIPYLPVHAADIETQSKNLTVLILPNLGALSDSECEAIRRFARGGGAVIASGATSLYNEWGEARRDFALADLFGAHAPSADLGKLPLGANSPFPSYLRLTPTLHGNQDPQPLQGNLALNARHPVLHGFEETDLIPFGGTLMEMRVDDSVVVPLTFVPVDGGAEAVQIREPKTQIPGLVLNQLGDARIAYLPADIDRRYVKNYLPDHANLLANIVRWAARDRLGFELRGPASSIVTYTDNRVD